jgi:holo-[acyl-carrier protein] synthase
MDILRLCLRTVDFSKIVLNISIGTDIVYIPRIQGAMERFGDRFLKRVYAPSEQETYRATLKSRSPKEPAIAYLAGRWAAKEAVVKALGTGWTGIDYIDIEICRHASGIPQVVLHRAAAAYALQQGKPQWQISVSHDHEYAIASALLIFPGQS